jgi:sulfatase modifying factor 1
VLDQEEICRVMKLRFSSMVILMGAPFCTPVDASPLVIPWVTVGNPGNTKDPLTTGLGAVAYSYQIGKNEITISQYSRFLNAKAKSDPYGLYNPKMGTDLNHAGIIRSGVSGSYVYTVIAGSGQKPITYVSWFDAARFCNWLHNGQGAKSTETGAYPLNGAMSGIIRRTKAANYWIPSQSEWYKAAYYDPTKGGVGGYWRYATQTDTLSGNSIGVAASANYFDGDYVGSRTSADPAGNALTAVGSYGVNSDSYYGTNDQSGNVMEWNDAVISSSMRGVRGGAWFDEQTGLRANNSKKYLPTDEYGGVGFRVANKSPSKSFFLLVFISGLIPLRRKR